MTLGGVIQAGDADNSSDLGNGETSNGSANAEAPLKVVNTPGFDLPRTGDNGTKMLTIAGALLILCAGCCVGLLIASRRKKNTKQ